MMKPGSKSWRVINPLTPSVAVWIQL